jgi:hypothetical protein
MIEKSLIQPDQPDAQFTYPDDIGESLGRFPGLLPLKNVAR